MANVDAVAAEIGWWVWGIPAHFNGFRVFASYTVPTSLNGRQSNFARRLASPGLLHYNYELYIFGGSCPVTEFCQVQNSLCVQILHSPILASLLHGARAVHVSQILRSGTRNGITELSLLVIFNREGGNHVGHRPTLCLLVLTKMSILP